MTAKLIYHTVETANGGVSPFDEAITALSHSGNLRIACPYLSLNYLKRLIRNCQSWRVLTDVEEWLSTHSSKARKEIVEFITCNSDYVHHYKNLHAKVVIADKSSIVGSANFTEMGILNRAEMSLLLDQEALLEELRTWFDRLWDESTSVDAQELKEYISKLPQESGIERNVVPVLLTSNAPRINASGLAEKPQKVKPRVESVTLNARDRLIERIKLSPNREWINSYFDLVQELIGFTDLAEDDPRLVMSIPKRPVLPVIINRRYVLSAFRHGKVMVRFILGAIDEIWSGSFYVSRFRPHADEAKEEAPYIAAYRSVLDPGLTSRVKQEWKKAVLFEVNHGKKSPFRYLHEPVFYRAATELDYRESILDEAFQ